MAYRRRRPHLISDFSDRGQTNNMEQLAFKYKEMCKVESSTDSDSEISPKSDTSTMECVSSAAESGITRRPLPRVHESVGRQGCYSLFLDPYDGSSEDSDGVNMEPRRTKLQGKGGRGRFSCRSRHFLLHPPSTGFRQPVKPATETPSECHLLDMHMKCLDNSDVWLCEMTGSQAVETGMDVRYHDAPMPESSLESTADSCNLQVMVKRKLDVPEVDELELRKRQCIVKMEEEED
ncbi:uncharacterized protein [Syngnathus scovelli]|uniref:uncharacterized protein n=1 Tax=Syngnathus scovelli TaxID=161590 RepID=UPI00210F979D|nr:uncharacterized protein LOC125980466 [Syngnathus scovelli]